MASKFGGMTEMVHFNSGIFRLFMPCPFEEWWKGFKFCPCLSICPAMCAEKKCVWAVTPKPYEPVSMAQLDARPTGDQEVAGSTPSVSATFSCGD